MTCAIYDHRTHTALCVTLTKLQIKAALKVWQRKNSDGKKPGRKFHTVKVSHHGAKTCHVSELYKAHCATERTYGIICADDDGEHPHADVIKDLAEHGIKYRVTGPKPTKEKPARRRGLALGAPLPLYDDQDIVLKFTNGKTQVKGGRLSRFHPVKKR